MFEEGLVILTTDLRELKSVLEIDPCDTSEDKNLNFYVEWASEIIETYLNRPGLSYASRTEYYPGTGTQKIQLNSRPVYINPLPQVFVDGDGYYGSVSGAFAPASSGASGVSQNTQLIYGGDFCLQMDSEDGQVSKSGLLIRINNLWPRPTVRQTGYLSPFVWESFGNVKVVYSAGYTVDNLPSAFRLACNLLVARLRYIFPLGMELAGESFEERNIALQPSQLDYLKGMIKPLLIPYRNWRF